MLRFDKAKYSTGLFKLILYERLSNRLRLDFYYLQNS